MSAAGRSTVAIGALVLGLVLVSDALAAGENLIYDPAFGQGLRGWRTVVVAHGSDPAYPHIVALKRPSEPMLKCERAQTGHSFLQMNVSDGAAAYVEQSIVVPASPGMLRFRTWAGLEPVKATVSVVDGPHVRQLLSYSPPALQATATSCSGAKPTVESLNLTRYAGEAVGIRIRATSAPTTTAQPLPASPEPPPATRTMAIADFTDFVLEAR
ncbi:MAG TPA: hypothetical protein VEJ23_09055 [Solirubrobacteraceae bacterium]|nr:hypothetical protein [Solirubrobacteraceae bacterium]